MRTGTYPTLTMSLLGTDRGNSSLICTSRWSAGRGICSPFADATQVTYVIIFVFKLNPAPRDHSILPNVLHQFRYDCERLVVGLDRVRAFGPGYCWDDGLTEGYNPHMNSYSVRPRGIKVDSLTR